MDDVSLLSLFATYNSWINRKILLRLSECETVVDDRIKASLFRHAIGVMNHIMAMDLIWLHRFMLGTNSSLMEELSAFALPLTMDEIISENVTEFSIIRDKVDKVLLRFVKSLSREDTQLEIQFISKSDSSKISGSLGQLLLHQLNHQTSHRGDVLSTLSALGLGIGNNDLLGIVNAPKEYLEAFA